MRLWPWMHPPKRVQSNQEDYARYTAYSQLLDRTGQWISIADTKAGVILGFLLATFPVLAAPALSVAQKVVKTIPHNASFWAYLPATGFIALLVLFLVAALITLLRILMTLSPRLTRQGKPSLIFFGDIASQDYTQWEQRMLTLDPHMLAQQVLEQVYATACIAALKHKHVRQAIRAMFITLLLGIGLYIVSQIIR